MKQPNFSQLLSLFSALLIIAAIPISAFSFPEFVLRNNDWGRVRSIEADITNERVNVVLRVHNEGDDGVLEWDVEVLHNEGEWISILGNLQRQVNPGQRSRAFTVRLDGGELDEGEHYYDTLRFTSNDPTNQVFDVPVAGHTEAYPRIEASWPGEWGGWWGIDLENVYDEIFWGEEYPVQIIVRNRGGAELVIEEISSDNGYFTVEPDSFNLNGGGARAIRIIFAPEEVGQQSATITSTSNAWDPRELNFRVIGGALPVFRMGVNLPDTSFDEDGGELLIADLDSIFLSSDHGIDFEVEAEGLIPRIARDHQFFLRSRPHWNGETEVIISTTLEDSTLADTFNVTVNPTPDPPDPFDLYYPYSGDTLTYGENGNIYFNNEGEITDQFVWQSSIDPDIGDTISYELSFFTDEDEEVGIIGELADTFASTDVLKELLENAEIPNWGSFVWTVTATDGENRRDAWSSNGFYLEDPNSIEQPVGSPGSHQLVEIYPNPFNGSTTISVNIIRPEIVAISVYDLKGRLIEQIADSQYLRAGSHQFNWTPTDIVSGKYFISVTMNGSDQIHPVTLTR